jgi:hypothetical protein
MRELESKTGLSVKQLYKWNWDQINRRGASPTEVKEIRQRKVLFQVTKVA